MEIIPAADPRSYTQFSSAELRSTFLVGGLFEPGQLRLRYWETDRAILGGATPGATPLVLGTARELMAATFCERRELGVINTGEAGTVEVDGVVHQLAPLDCLYVGRGARQVAFSSNDPRRPARFYLLSYPAHAAYPTTLAHHAETAGTALGAPETSNSRTIYKYIHAGGIRSCQLVMGLTLLNRGSIWNTMPPHTHTRRSEVYLYFNIPANAAVFHFMGRPQDTRHLLVRDREAVLSPPWSIHCGAGTDSYGFIWGMGGENQDFADMDPAPLSELR